MATGNSFLGSGRDFVTVHVDAIKTRMSMRKVATALRRHRYDLNMAIAIVIADLTRNNFGINGRSRPTVWPPYARTYSPAKRKGSPATLIGHGVLMTSIRAAASYRAGIVSAEGSRNYAAAQQFGSRFLPARPYFPVFNAGGSLVLDYNAQLEVQKALHFYVRKILGER